MFRILFTVLFCWFSLSLHSQKELPSITLDTTLISDDFEVVSPIFEGKKMVFFGENHSFSSSNQLLKLKSVLYLHDLGFRYMVIELGAGIAYLANEYIQTGDEDALKLLNRGRSDREENSLHYLLLTLREFNKDKAPKDKIKIIGVDYTRYPVYSLKALAKIIETKKCQEELSQFYEDLEVVSSVNLSDDGIGFASMKQPSKENFDLSHGFKSYRNRLFELSVRNIVNDYKKDSIMFERLLGQYNEQFKEIISELDETVKWYAGEGINIQMHIERERHIAENIQSILKKDTSARITGQFGRCHVQFAEYEDECFSFSMNSMVERLQKDSLLQGKVLTIPIFYTQNTEVKINKDKTDAKLSDLIPGHNIYIYETKDDLLNIKGVKSDSGVVLLNTYWSFTSIKDILEKNYDQTEKARPSRRKEIGEEHLSPQVSYIELSNNINEDLGTELLPGENWFFGLTYEQIDREGWQSKFSFNAINPINKELDSVEYRYTNWFLRSGVGYNFIYREHFDLYMNANFDFGIAKVREDRGFKESQFIYDHEPQISKYRNPYFNVGAEFGTRLKFGPVGIFALAGYQYDVTNPKWRLNNIIPDSRGLRFASWYLTGGLSYIF